MDAMGTVILKLDGTVLEEILEENNQPQIFVLKFVEMEKI